jgi:hypothetical protein
MILSGGYTSFEKNESIEYKIKRVVGKFFSFTYHIFIHLGIVQKVKCLKKMKKKLDM